MFELLKSILSGHSQIASGGLLLMIIGGAGVYLRAVPQRLWDWFVSQTTMVITVKDDDAAFVWIKEWFLDQEFVKRIRRVDLDTTLRGEILTIIPAPGRHWFWHAGRPFTVSFHRSEKTSSIGSRRSESFSFRTLGRDPMFLRRFADEVAESHEKSLGLKSSFFIFDEYWERVSGYFPRPVDSVILNPGEKEALIEDIRRFKASRQRYFRLGVPYHRGVLLHGPPGTGKTSLISAVASHFGMSIYAVSLNEFNDRTLRTAISSVPANSVILFEDIDCMTSGKAGEREHQWSRSEKPDGWESRTAVGEQLGVTLSGLLNVLDGFSAPENVVFAMTTNRIEALDPALLRPGRIDYKLRLGEASEEQKIALYRRFFPFTAEPEALAFVNIHTEVKTMAEFQGVLLKLDQSRPADVTGTEPVPADSAEQPT